jgi:hypothetical protein
LKIGSFEIWKTKSKTELKVYQIKEKKLNLGVTKNEDGCKQDILYILAILFFTWKQRKKNLLNF